MKALNNSQIVEVSGGFAQILLSADAVRHHNWSFTEVVATNAIAGVIILTGMAPMFGKPRANII
jgi:hypothetical protein